MNRGLHLFSFLNICLFPVSLILTKYTISSLLSPSLSHACVHRHIGICISQNKQGYAMVTNNSKTSVDQNNKDSLILHTCPSFVSQSDFAYWVTQTLWLMYQPPSWAWSVITFEGNSPQARNALRLARTHGLSV